MIDKITKLVPTNLKDMISISEQSEGNVELIFPNKYGLAGRTILKDYLRNGDRYYYKFADDPRFVLYRSISDNDTDIPSIDMSIKKINLTDKELLDFEKLSKEPDVVISSIDSVLRQSYIIVAKKDSSFDKLIHIEISEMNYTWVYKKWKELIKLKDLYPRT